MTKLTRAKIVDELFRFSAAWYDANNSNEQNAQAEIFNTAAKMIEEEGSAGDELEKARVEIRLGQSVIEAADKYVTARELELPEDEVSRRYATLFDALEAREEPASDKPTPPKPECPPNIVFREDEVGALKQFADAIVAAGIGGMMDGLYACPGMREHRPASRFVSDWRTAGACLEVWPTTINTEHLRTTLDQMLRDPRSICEAFISAVATKQGNDDG